MIGVFATLLWPYLDLGMEDSQMEQYCQLERSCCCFCFQDSL